IHGGVGGVGVVVGGVRLSGGAGCHVGGVGEHGAVSHPGTHRDVHGEDRGQAHPNGHAAAAGLVLADRRAVHAAGEAGARGQGVGDGDAAGVHRGAAIGDRQRVVETGRVTGDGGGGGTLGDGQVGAGLDRGAGGIGVVVGGVRL